MRRADYRDRSADLKAYLSAPSSLMCVTTSGLVDAARVIIKE